MRGKEEIEEELQKLHKGREWRENPKDMPTLSSLESRTGRYYIGEAEGWIQALEWVLEIRDKP